MNRSFIILYLLAAIFSFSCNQNPELTPAEAEEIAREAYIYGFPMVVNYKALYLYTLDEQSPEYKSPLNEKSCDARLYTPEDKAVVSPNSDTPYCMFWMDLRAEPVVLTMPEMEEERYYSFQLIDLYTHNFAYLGTLTTGNGAGTYMIKPGDWKGKIPEGIDQVLDCETDLFFVVVRTQLMDPDDLEQVKIIQGEYKVQTLSQFNGNETQDVPESMEYPVWNEGDQFTAAAFTYLDFMLDYMDPLDEEMAIRKRIARLGIGTKEGFSLESFDDEIQNAIQEGVKKGFHDFEEFIARITADPLASAKIFGTREFLSESAEVNYQLEDFYLPRAIAAHLGLYGNSGAEAIYPAYILSAEGTPFNAAENNYTLTFEPGQLPPVKAFWSLTMYDGQTQLLIQNPMNRYLLNSDMTDDFVYGEDGTLTLYIQKESPGPELENNWLPAPDGHFLCIMRLYGPEESALTGEWVNPPLVISN